MTRRPRGDTGAAPLRPVAEETGHLPARGATGRPERDTRFAGRGPASGEPPSRPAAVADAREPEYEPEAPVTRMLPTVDAPGAAHTGVNPAVAPLPEPEPAVDEPVVPRSRPTRRRPGSEDADGVADTPRRTARDTGRARVGRRTGSREPVELTASGVPVAAPEPADVPQVESVEEPPVRRDPAVISLLDPGIAFPDLPGTPVVGRGRRHADDATTPPAGHRAVVDPPAATEDLLAGLRGDPRNDPPVDPLSAPLGDLPDEEEPTPWGGTRYASADPRSDEPGPSFPDPVPDPEPVPISRMAIGDIPLADVPLLDAELDSEPAPQPVPTAGVPAADAEQAPRAQLPRRRPGATRRRGAAEPSEGVRSGRRRRAAEDDVLSDWMSAEIAARPSGRHAQPGVSHAGSPHGGAQGGASTNGTSRRSRTERRADDPAGPDADLFRPLLDDGPDGDAGRHRR